MIGGLAVKKIVKKSLSNQVADDIELRIKKGEFNIGDKLPTEPELVSMYDVSRNTIREAIQSLTRPGILETRQGDGTYVIAKERLQVELYNMMDKTANKNVFEVRNMLENFIVIKAIDNADDKDLIDIEQALQTRKAETDSIREKTQADLYFHLSIAKATHNDLIVEMYKYVSAYFNEFIYDKIYRKIQNQQYIDEIHDSLFVAIKNKDIIKAKDCINKIIEI